MSKEETTYVSGVKLKNPLGSNQCYLNTAINCVAVNPQLRALVFGEEIQQEISANDISRELKSLLRLENEVGNSAKLRRLMNIEFNRFEEGEQNDAADAFLSMLGCISGALHYFRLKIRVQYTCVECGHQKSKIDDDQLSIMLYDASNVMISLQEALDRWVSKTSIVEFSCECKERCIMGSIPVAENKYTKHRKYMTFWIRQIFYISRLKIEGLGKIPSKFQTYCI